MPTRDLIIGFANRRRHRLKNRIVSILAILSYLLPFLTLVYVDLSKQARYLIPIALIALAFNLLAVPIWVWSKYIRLFGPPSLKECRDMLSLDALKPTLLNPHVAKGRIADGVLFMLVISLLFCLAWRWTDLSVFSYPAVYCLCVAIKAPIRRSRPPGVLLLGGSSYEGTRLQQQLIPIFDPSLVMSGLFHKQNDIVHVTGVFSDFNSVRTLDYAKWQEMIFSVIQLSRIVIIDIRKITEAVTYEIELARNLLAPERVYYIGKAVDSVPPERCFEEAALMNELRSKYRPQRRLNEKHPASTYEDGKNGYFRFTPPTGWVLSETRDPRTKVAFSHPTNRQVSLSLIVSESQYEDFPSLLQQQMTAIREAETDMGAHCQMEVVDFAGKKTIVTRVDAPNGEVILNRRFVAHGLHFNIAFSAPKGPAFDANRVEADRALESIEILPRTVSDPVRRRQLMGQQEIANLLRLAELAADYNDVGAAHRIIEDLLRRHPENKEAQRMASDLGWSGKGKT